VRTQALAGVSAGLLDLARKAAVPIDRGFTKGRAGGRGVAEGSRAAMPGGRRSAFGPLRPPSWS
jgi:hypothetical protein